MLTALLITTIVIAALVAALAGAYMSGALNPYIEKIGMYFFKAKAEAEEKKLEAQGLKEGQDFFKGELKGNQQANEVAQGIGGLGGLEGLKKQI